jgi:predicted nucleic acid-binding protein
MIPLRLVVDTNIVVSAALKPDGLQRTVLLLAIAKPARLYVTDAILAEYREVLTRPELKIRRGLRQQLLQLIKSRTMRSPSTPCGFYRWPRTPMTTSFWSAPALRAPTTW